MSIPFDSAIPGTDSELESNPENMGRKPDSQGTCGNAESFCGEIAPDATRYAMSIVRIWADAEEVVQEAFCRLLQANRLSDNPDRETESSDKALLFATVRNLAIDRLRKQKRRRFEPLDMGQIPSGKSLSNETNLKRLEQNVQAILKDLPNQWSDALQLKVNGGLSYEQIASVLDATHAQVRTWIYRARKQLEKDLNQQGLLNRGNA